MNDRVTETDQIADLRNRIQSLEDSRKFVMLLAGVLAALGIGLGGFLSYVRSNVSTLETDYSTVSTELQTIKDRPKIAIEQIDAEKEKDIKELDQEVTKVTHQAVPRLEMEIAQVKVQTDFIYFTAKLFGQTKLTHPVNTAAPFNAPENANALDATERWMFAIMDPKSVPPWANIPPLGAPAKPGVPQIDSPK